MENLDIISKFEYNYKKYVIALINKKELMFAYFDNQKKLRMDLSDKDKEIFGTVYNAIRVKKENSIRCFDMPIKGVKYSIWYDYVSKNYYWFPNDNPNDNIYLNFLFNNYSEYVYSKKNPKKRKKVESKKEEEQSSYGKWLRSFGKTIFLSAALCIGALSTVVISRNADLNLNNMPMLQEMPERVVQKQESESVRRIISSVEENENFTDDERKFTSDYLKVLLTEAEKYSSLDVEDLVHRLKTLKFKYKSEITEEEKARMQIEEMGKEVNVDGIYGRKENIIYMFDREKFRKCSVSTPGHEVGHVVEPNKAEREYNGILEFINERKNEDVLRQLVDSGKIDKEQFKVDNLYMYGTGYNYAMKYYYLFEKLFDDETIKKAGYTLDMKYFEEALVKINNEKREIIKRKTR